MIGFWWIIIGSFIGYVTYVVFMLIRFHLKDKKNRSERYKMPMKWRK